MNHNDDDEIVDERPEPSVVMTSGEGVSSTSRHSRSSSTPTTHVIYTKTSCYFCSEWLENDSFKDHIGQCSQTLVECPNSCSAYVQRKLLESHLQTCPRAASPISSIASSSNTNHRPVTDERRILIDHLVTRLHQLEDDITFVRSALNEETRQRHKLIVDVGNLRQRNAVEDEWTLKVGDVLASFKKCLGEETENRGIDVQQVRVDIGRLELQYQEINEWRNEMQAQLEQLEHEVIPDGSMRDYIDVLMKDNRISALKIYSLESDVKQLRMRSEDANRMSAANDALLMEKMAQIDEFLANEKEPRLRNSPLPTPQASLPELTTKMATLDFEVKSLKHIASAAEDKCDALERTVVDSRKSTAQTRQLLADLEEHLRLQRSMAAIQSVNGHLVWRINGFAEQLREAKENEVTLHSPLFCNRPYGYTMRLDVHLNGIGTWRGRNILACLTVVPGEYDPLLAWPCKLKADIILRDQPDDLTKANDTSKTIVSKASQDTHEQSQYIFITHKNLKKEHYLRNDAIFFEVRVHQEASSAPSSSKRESVIT